MRIFVFSLILFFWPAMSMAQTDLSTLFPDKDIDGWSRLEEPKKYVGDELFMMIDGGADIYFEYGFSQALAGDFENEKGDLIRLEIYEMKDPASAYGIYSFKIGQQGKPLDIGQAALLEEYYLNFWKGNLLVTIAGPDSRSETLDAISDFGRFIDQHYAGQGSIPELAQLFLSEPAAFSHLKYVLGGIGAMSSYVFDTEDIFKVREGVVGTVGGNKTFVFRYSDSDESTKIFNEAAARFNTGQRFTETALQDNLCTMVDRDNNAIIIKRDGSSIVAVIGQDLEEISPLSKTIAKKLGSL